MKLGLLTGNYVQGLPQKHKPNWPDGGAVIRAGKCNLERPHPLHQGSNWYEGSHKIPAQCAVQNTAWTMKVCHDRVFDKLYNVKISDIYFLDFHCVNASFNKQTWKIEIRSSKIKEVRSVERHGLCCEGGALQVIDHNSLMNFLIIIYY